MISKRKLGNQTLKGTMFNYLIKNTGLKVICAISGFVVLTIFVSVQNASVNVIPHGRLEKFSFTESKIFPGTYRDVTVYIPAQIDEVEKACVYVQQDGYFEGQKPDRVFDELIANNEMPVTVGIFITSGHLPAPDTNTLNRPNRCFEYDGVGDRYARFVLEEILPIVEMKYSLKLSNSGNDRCIAGLSSGGISSFNAAWERPDAFSRVYCVSGSFVAFRGGNEFPTLVRKTEPKPIRIFHTTGSNDMTNCAGDWTLIDMEMEKALIFSGYENKYTYLEGGHCVGWSELFAEGMQYLWEGWPEPVQKGEGAPRVKDIILPGEEWQFVSDEYTGAKGLACRKNGEIYFTVPEQNKIFFIGVDGVIKPFSTKAYRVNSLTFDAENNMFGVSSKEGKIFAFDLNGEGKVYKNDVNGQYICASPRGSFYVSDSSGKTWLVNKDNKIKVDSALNSASGIAISPDQWLLAVADKKSHWVYSYQINEDGTLKNKEQFYWVQQAVWDDDSGAESVCYDREGHFYIATRMGVQVCAWDGPVQVILPLPHNEKVNGMCIGGKEMNELYVFCKDRIYKRKIKNHSIGAYSPWVKMTAGKL